MNEQEKLLAFIAKMAPPGDTIFEAEKTLSPLWIFETEEGKVGLISTPWPDQDAKVKSVEKVKKLLKEKNAVRYMHVAEVWLLDEIEEIPDSIKMGGSVASHPDRKEAIVALAEDKAGNCYQRIRYIVREEDGQVSLSPALLIRTEEKATGLLTGLLNG